MKNGLTPAFAVAVTLLAGCAALPPPQSEHLAAEDSTLRECAAWYARLDAAVDEAGVRDASAWRVPGFPYLRLDRLTASFAVQARGDARAFDAWLARARALDAEAREVEIGNLPPQALAALDMDAAQAKARSAGCAQTLAARDLATRGSREQLLERARVPDDYVGWQRVVGLYPVTSVPFASGVERWHAEAEAMFRATRAGAAPQAEIRRYAPPAGATLTRAQVAAILARAPRDALGVPQPAAADLEQLFATFAPVFAVETGGAYDRPGALYWSEAPVAQVDAARPTVYRRVAHTRYDKDVLLQLVYTTWFSERPGDDILAGKLDGVVWRVTLTPDGAPLVYDSMHPCGCFHMFFPTTRARVTPAPEPNIEWAFAPLTLPAIEPRQRLALRVASRTHYLLDVAPDAGGAATRYAFADENGLRALALPGGGTRSLYGPDGLVPGSERPERMLFWPMGIPSAGQMRQWGHHATAFLGRRHFDDADLIERRFHVTAGAR